MIKGHRDEEFFKSAPLSLSDRDRVSRQMRRRGEIDDGGAKEGGVGDHHLAEVTHGVGGLSFSKWRLISSVQYRAILMRSVTNF